MPAYREYKKEPYKLSFVSFDDPDVYIKQLLNVNKTDFFETDLEREEFFRKVKLATVQLKYEYGFEMLCCKYGVNGYPLLSTPEIAEIFGHRDTKRVTSILRVIRLRVKLIFESMGEDINDYILP